MTRHAPRRWLIFLLCAAMTLLAAEAAASPTRILVAIGHGTQIGAGCLLVAQVGVAGST